MYFLRGFCVFLFSCLYVSGVSSLRDVRLVIMPPKVLRGETATIICNRDMEGDPLYSVKWYRGIHEFYRFTPNEYPETRVFGLPGIYVDMNRSNGTQVFLRRLDLNLAGVFACEVTADFPIFSTLVAKDTLDIVVPPSDGPVLETNRDEFKPKDLLIANCSSKPSSPASNLTIYINDQPYSPSESSLHTSEAGFFWATTKIEVQVSPEHFVGGRLRLTCKSSIYDVYDKSATLDFFTPETDPRPERITLSTGNKNIFNWLMMLFILCLPSLVVGQYEEFFDFAVTDYEEIDKRTLTSLLA